MDFNEIKVLDEENIVGCYGRFALGIESGEGARCKSFDGKEYIDFTSGIGVNSLGFCDEKWVKAVCEQAGKLNHTSNLYYTAPGTKLAEVLCKKTGGVMKKVFFANSGAEANECAIKTARKYGSDKYGEGRNEIITLINSFHGRTLTTLSATGQDVFHKNFGPFTEGFLYAKANDFADVESKVSEKTCAVMMEVVQGEGGVVALDEDFVKAVANLCKEKDILLIIDEVQTGIGRTGKLFGYMNYGVEPDIVTSAKGLGGGLPIGAALFGAKTESVLGKGDHGSTFGMNPICCAGALAVMESVTDVFLLDVKRKGDIIKTKLEAMSCDVTVSGMGMMIGVEIKGKDSKQIVASALENGLMLLTAKNKVRMLPPLNISDEDIEEGLEILEKTLKNM